MRVCDRHGIEEKYFERFMFEKGKKLIGRRGGRGTNNIRKLLELENVD
jgi:hypothetical protein